MTDRTRARQGDTLDRICHRHYGYTAGITEAVLEANPGLCELGALLPSGTPVTLPAIAPAATAPSVQLWQ